MGRIFLAFGLLAGGFLGTASAVETELSKSGTPVALVMAPTGGGNYDINVIRDGVKPDTDIGENVGASNQQYDTYDGANGASQTEDWIGYHFDCTYAFTRVVFQEGKHFGNGGWFDPPESLIVQTEDPTSGEWTTVPGTWDPEYPGRLTNGEIMEFETFTWTGDAPVTGSGIRIYGTPGGGGADAFISVGELEVYAEIPGIPPEIIVTYGPAGGPPPLDVVFDASGSKGDALSFNWDFGDGAVATDSKPTHTFDTTGNYRVTLTISTVVGGCTQSDIKTIDISVGNGLIALGHPIALVLSPTGGGNHDINVIRDGNKPAILIGENAGNSQEQYDTYDGANPLSQTEDWIGYHFDTPYDIQSLVFQEGKHFNNGGWFDPPDSLVVQVEDPASGDWIETPGTWDPQYPGRLTNGQIVEFETFTWTSDEPVTATGIRIYGTPGGGGVDRFISCAELEVFTPASATVTRSADKPVFALGDTILVSLDIAMKLGDAISLDEIVPPGVTVTEISDGGVQTDSTIHWDLSGVATARVSYRVAPPPCGTELIFGRSSWTIGFSRGQVDGTAALNLDLGGDSLGAWTATDFTAPGSGALSLSDHDLLVKGTGDGVKNLGAKDSFRFVSRPASGDFEITAQIECFDDPGANGQAGVMVRDALAESSAQAFIYFTRLGASAGSEGVIVGRIRKATADPALKNTTFTLSNREVTALPVWLRLRRGTGGDGKTYVYFERSDDGAVFTEMSKKETIATVLDLKEDVSIGLGVSGSGAGVTSATFRQVSGPVFTGEPLQQPSGLQAVASAGKVSLAWSAPAGGPSPTAYAIYRDNQFLVQVPEAPLSYDDLAVTAGQEYCYTVASRKGAAESPRTDPACATVPPAGALFRRGDVDGNGKIEVTDAIGILGHLFLGDNTAWNCPEAADTDNDTKVDVTDAVNNLNFQFLGGTPPAAPGPRVCGPDDGPVFLGCGVACN